MNKFSEMYEKYGKHKIELPFRDCWFCENIEDCPHPDISNDIIPKPIPPKECVRSSEIELTQRKENISS